MSLLWPLTLALDVLAYHHTVLLVRSFEAVGETRGMVIRLQQPEGGRRPDGP
jgi:hypothetical protein